MWLWLTRRMRWRGLAFCEKPGADKICCTVFRKLPPVSAVEHPEAKMVLSCARATARNRTLDMAHGSGERARVK